MAQALGREPARRSRRPSRASSSFHPTSLDASTTDDESGSVAYLLGDDDESLARVDDRVCLGAALSGLDAEERQLLALRYVDELTQREIGMRLGMSQMQVSRALRRVVCTPAGGPGRGRRGRPSLARARLLRGRVSGPARPTLLEPDGASPSRLPM